MAGADRVTQVKLVRGSWITYGWVRADSRLRPGVQVRLEGDPGWWDVAEVHETIDRSLIRTDWLVGGNRRHDR